LSRSALALILLAAGASSRYGSPKQLLRIDGEALVRRAARSALECGAEVLVVTGAAAAEVGAQLDDLPVARIHNADWAQGMGGSIACGIRQLQHGATPPAAVIVCLADQPLIGRAQLQQLIDAHHAAPAAIVVADHGTTLGPPCLFPAAHFHELAALRGAQGARKVIDAHRDEVVAVAMPEAAVDIDTPDDYAVVLRSLGRD
jgi:CTP:molybdopterin cytidylyltransferase MocA